ncbi:hypothetical protein HK100_008821 [Physocladia obscura]|uniref:Ankyrin repeat protein n=1 Tax=Physocladia obscura TaxID=109957 RepID=A0AAD5T9R1_9FUNG|nr:hypothetical protein HK100_008821 [Physocladia obscura]
MQFLALEIQETIIAALPIDRSLRHVQSALRIPVAFEDMFCVKKHILNAVLRGETAMFEDWAFLPPFYRAALIAYPKFWKSKSAKSATPDMVTSAVKIITLHKIKIEPKLKRDPYDFLFSSKEIDWTGSLLEWSVRHDAINAIEFLLQTGDDDPAANENAALRIACEHGHTNVAALLLQDSRVDPNAECSILEFSGCLAEVIQQKSVHLITAALNGHINIVELLLKDSRRQGNENQALVAAARNGHLHVARVLLSDARCDPTWDESACLRAACYFGSIPIVSLLLAETKVNINALKKYWDLSGCNYDSPLRQATTGNHLAVIELLKRDIRLDLNLMANKVEIPGTECERKQLLNY